jgi:hypothetical protein
MEKNLDYYMNLKYEMVVRELSKEMVVEFLFVVFRHCENLPVNAWGEILRSYKTLNIVKKNYLKLG